MRFLRTDCRGTPIPWRQRKRPPGRRHPYLPKLFYLAQNRQWQEAIQRARTHPHEITIQEESTGNTPLHVACRLNPPSEVVRALCNDIINNEGATPLHMGASHRCSVEVLQVLLESSSSTATLTRVGRAPIHYACMSFRGLTVESFELLLDATIQHGFVSHPNDLEDLMEDDDDNEYPNGEAINVMTMRDSTGQTPLGLLFRRYRERVRCVIQTVERLRKEQPSILSLQAAMTIHADLGGLWNKARLIVTKLSELQRPGILCHTGQDSPGEQAIAEAAAEWAAEQHRKVMRGHQDDNRRAFRIVHASVGLTGYGCPPEMIRLALSIHPEQIQEMDEDGNLPIHIAAVASSITADGGNDEDGSMMSDYSFLSTAAACSNAFDKVIRILIRQYPAAARIPHGVSGKLPLMLALEKRTWEDGIQTLLDAFPAALHAKRMLPGVYPHLLAKIGRHCMFLDEERGAKSHGDRGLATLFEILKAKPDLLRCDNIMDGDEPTNASGNDHHEPGDPTGAMFDTMHI